MAAAVHELVAMQTNVHSWAEEHLDHALLNGDIDPPCAQLELAIRERIKHQGANNKSGMMLIRCGGFEWTLWTPVCTQTSNAIKQWAANRSDPRRPMRLLEFSFPDMDPYVLDRVLFYHLNLRVEIPEEKHITMANFDRFHLPNANNTSSDGTKCNQSTTMILIKLYDAAWKFDDNLLKEIVLSMLRTRLFTLQYTLPEFFEAISVIGNRKEPNQRNKTLNKILLTAAVMIADDLLLSDDYCDAFLVAQSAVFKERVLKGQAWCHKYYRPTRQTVMEY